MASSLSLGNASLANATSAQAFYTHFRSATDTLLTQLSEDAATSAESLQQALQSYVELNAELTRAVDSGVLPSHDQGVHKRRLEEVAAALERKRRVAEQQQQQQQQQQQPCAKGDGRKKGGFAFKRKQPTVASVTPTTASESTSRNDTPAEAAAGGTAASEEPPSLATTSQRQSSHLTISALHEQKYTPPPSSESVASQASMPVSIDLTDISNSIVDLRPLEATHTLLAVQIRNVTNSVVALPPIEGSVMLHHLKNCILSVASCHQFRMHVSTDSVVDLTTKRGSVVTIEACTGITFATGPEGLKVQDFDDLINSDQLKQHDGGESKANFKVVSKAHRRMFFGSRIAVLSRHDQLNSSAYQREFEQSKQWLQQA